MHDETGPNLRELYLFVRPHGEPPQYEVIAGADMPQPYRDLLVHDQHMTVTVEAYHRDLVNVMILERRQEGDVYARKILLTLQKTGRVVQFGIVRVNLAYIPEAPRAEILEGKKPFGRILIEHNVHRRVEPTTYLRIIPGAAMMGWFGMSEPSPVYGRLAYIHCDGQPAVELLEVIAPE